MDQVLAFLANIVGVHPRLVLEGIGDVLIDFHLCKVILVNGLAAIWA